MKDVLTLAEMHKAIAVLEANNVPPIECPSCKSSFYVVAPDAPMPWRVVCECGEEWLIGSDG